MFMHRVGIRSIDVDMLMLDIRPGNQEPLLPLIMFMHRVGIRSIDVDMLMLDIRPRVIILGFTLLYMAWFGVSFILRGSVVPCMASSISRVYWRLRRNRSGSISPGIFFVPRSN